jgi:hypothetical protein
MAPSFKSSFRTTRTTVRRAFVFSGATGGNGDDISNLLESASVGS